MLAFSHQIRNALHGHGRRARSYWGADEAADTFDGGAQLSLFDDASARGEEDRDGTV